MSEGIFNVTTVGCGGQVMNIHLYTIPLRLIQEAIFYSKWIAFGGHAINISTVGSIAMPDVQGNIHCYICQIWRTGHGYSLVYHSAQADA